MINFHPDDALLLAFAADNLPVGMALAVAIHVEYCPRCRARVAEHEAMLASQFFAEPMTSTLDHEFDEMLSMILSQPVVTTTEQPAAEVSSLSVAGQTYALPRALRSVQRKNWLHVGAVGRSRLILNDEQAGRASLFYLPKGSSVPKHTHVGQEIMLPLDGAFSDELGDYRPGDFLIRDSQVDHQPVTEEGCLCFALLDAPVKFTQGLPRLLNGFGDLLY